MWMSVQLIENKICIQCHDNSQVHSIQKSMYIYLKLEHFTFAAKKSLVFPSGNGKSSFRIICIMKLQLTHSDWGSAIPSITVTSAHVQAQKQSAWPRGGTWEQSSAQDEVHLRFAGLSTAAMNQSAYVSQTELIWTHCSLCHGQSFTACTFLSANSGLLKLMTCIVSLFFFYLIVELIYNISLVILW